MPDVNDATTAISDLREIMAKFVADRNWQQFHNPKNLSMSLGIETSELMEHYQWLSLSESLDYHKSNDATKTAVADEVADCLAYVLAIANALDLDLATEFRRKMKKNEQKYPVLKNGLGTEQKPTI